MKPLNQVLQGVVMIIGAGLALVVSHFYGGKVVLIGLIILFAFLIGLAQWNKHKKKS